MLHKKAMIHLRWVIRTTIAVTGGLSVWINTLHVAPGNTVGLVIAAVPPVFVIASLELANRIPVEPNSKWFQKWPRPVAMIVVAAVAAVLSYVAQRQAIRIYGDPLEALLIPILVDGFMVIASVSLYQISAHLRKLDAAQNAQAIKTTRVPSEPRKNAKDLTKKEQIAVLVDRFPAMKATELAERTGASVNYATTLRNELLRAGAAELTTAEMEAMVS
jgi:hypothetical protein